jgi:hypothetical protein
MKELYRTYYYGNGYEFRLEGVVQVISDKSNMTLVQLTTGETVVVVPGWIATKFMPAPLPPQAVTVQQDTDGDQAR